jgi:hypothetical protein
VRLWALAFRAVYFPKASSFAETVVEVWRDRRVVRAAVAGHGGCAFDVVGDAAGFSQCLFREAVAAEIARAGGGESGGGESGGQEDDRDREVALFGEFGTGSFSVLSLGSPFNHVNWGSWGSGSIF